MLQPWTSSRACEAAPGNPWRAGKILTVGCLLASLALGSDVASAQTSTGTRTAFAAHAVVNFQEVARQEKLHPRAMQKQRAVAVPETRHVNLPVPAGAPTIHLKNRGDGAQEASSGSESSASASAQGLSPAPLSPAARPSFAGASDNQLRIPPSANGAVSPTYLVETVNGTFSVQDRAGNLLQPPVFMDTFWAGVGGVADVVNARVVYDPYNNRWIMAAEANGNSSTSALLIGVSQTPNPMGVWNLWKVASDTGYWANFPALGFNANWVAVSMNMYPLTTGAFKENIYVFDKAKLYSIPSVLSYTKSTDASGAGTYVPAVTFDNNLPTKPLYLLQTWNNNPGDGNGYLRLGSIPGAFTSPPPKVNFLVTFASFPSPWGGGGVVSNGGFAPQLGTTTLIDTYDDRMQNVVYRNGFIWGTQTIFLPASAPTHSAVQWFGFDPNINGFYSRIDDPNGVEFRAFPSIAVNKSDDALIGYSTFSATTYAAAAYSFSSHRDTSFFEAEQLLHGGLGPYVKYYNNPTSTNFWGFYSGTAVDPANDTDLWTLQEFADTNSGVTGDYGNWGTWWGMVEIAATKFNVNPNPGPVTAGAAFTMNVTAADNSDFAVTGYGGTVHFTSNDPTAVLPADYTFTEADQGVHTFNGLSLHTAGSPSITITDVATSVNFSVTISVTPAATSNFVFAAPSPTTAGTAFSVTATAYDPYFNPTPAYSGTVKFTSSDAAATLPANYTFIPGDLGTHTFINGVVLRTAGIRSVTVADVATPTTAGTKAITVNSAALNHLGVSAPPTASVGYPFNFTVAAQDQFNNTVPSYTGTVSLTPSGVAANVAPTPYTFVAGDKGVHGFSATVTGAAPSTLTLTANDAVNSVSGSANVAVVSDLPLTLRGRKLRFRVGLPFTLVVADLTDTDSAETGANLSGTIDWGDGTAPTPATIVPPPVLPGVFLVEGSHRYLSRGAFSITVQINDSAGFQTSGTSKATMGPKPSSF